ncbi:hypothetical protein RE428_32090 [Marinobacter nanhaiticus D15-8W]|uniref:Uncharacterized protein n=1 Tax=Marinobacter nanhaiticus D15-8W TaxID=626887 RepID=N6WZB9_9GAMM|nr:hypothetical protein [Marinobacter nanhaiticus]ENO16901.1 hypothetical protein J057_01815 [Marinobacter nanhaiticus D15-8W]BES72191.1 hypothetical protein RE428_32090 [Marinobacter nanhaiticus D15-8W]
MTQSQRDKILKVLGENKDGLTPSKVTEYIGLEVTVPNIYDVRNELNRMVKSGTLRITNENRYQLVFGGYDPDGGDAA